jgi:pimeloyl-ACP methyl ester carboxylesterase
VNSQDGAVGGVPGTRWSAGELDVKVGGLRLHVLDARRREPAGAGGGGRTLVMLHGMTSHGDAWRPVIAAMSAAGRVICPDLRGHGQSDWTTDGYWLADYANDVMGLLDAMGIGEVDLVGQSLGARVAMVLGARLGARLRTMILLDTGPEVSRSAAEKARSVVLSTRSKTAFRDEDELRAFLREEQPEWTEVSIEVRAARLYRWNWAGKLVNRGDPDVGWLFGRAGLRERDDMWEGLRVTSASVCVVRGERSYLLDDELARRMRDAAADGTYLELPYGHYIPYQAPEALATTIDQFLQAHP